MACTSASNADDFVVDHIDHNSPVEAPSVGNLRPGPTFDTPSPNYGVYSSLHKKRFIVGADGQCHAEKYSFRPVARNTLYERKKIESFMLNEFKKSIIVNSVSSSNVTSHEAVRITTNNDLTESTFPNFTAPRYTIKPDTRNLPLPPIPPSLHRREVINYENLFDVDVSVSSTSTNPTTPQGTSSSAVLPTTATKRRLPVVSPEGGQLSDSPTTPQDNKKEKPKRLPIPTAIRQRPRAFMLDIGIEQVVPMDEITFGIFSNLPRNPQHYQQPADDVPLHFAAHYLLGKNDTLPDNSSQRLNLLYHLVFMRARFTIPPDNMFIRIEDVPGWKTCHQWKYDDFPRNTDELIKLWRNWQLDNPIMVKLRELILDVGEHGKEEVLTLLKDAKLLDEVWEKTHDYDWYVKKILKLHKEGQTCYPGCQFCKGTLFTGAIHNDEDHKKLKAQQQKKGTRHTSRATGLPGQMVEPCHLNKHQHAEQAPGIHPTCASRHAMDTFDKIRNGKGDYEFRRRVQYAYTVVLVLHVNGYICKHSGVEITWDTYPAYDAEHPAMGMNVLIDGVEFPTRKIISIAHIWQKSWKSFAEYFDAARREVTMTYIVNRMAHRLIGYGHHEKRCHLFPALPPFPFEKATGLDGRDVLKPKSLPPTNSTTTTSVETVTNISTTTTASTINIKTATTTDTTTNTSSIRMPELDADELLMLRDERIRVNGVISAMKKKGEEKKKKEKPTSIANPELDTQDLFQTGQEEVNSLKRKRVETSSTNEIKVAKGTFPQPKENDVELARPSLEQKLLAQLEKDRAARKERMQNVRRMMENLRR